MPDGTSANRRPSVPKRSGRQKKPLDFWSREPLLYYQTKYSN
jgi:hypothetical protein